MKLTHLTVLGFRANSDNLSVIPFPYNLEPDHRIPEAIRLCSFVAIAGLVETRVLIAYLGVVCQRWKGNSR